MISASRTASTDGLPSLRAPRDKARTDRALRVLWPHGAIVGVAVAAGLVVGLVAGRSTVDRTAHVAGACMALDMAEAHGALEEPRRKRIIHSLTSVTNPHLDRFPVTRTQMLRVCSDIKAAVWPGH